MDPIIIFGVLAPFLSMVVGAILAMAINCWLWRHAKLFWAWVDLLWLCMTFVTILFVASDVVKSNERAERSQAIEIANNYKDEMRRAAYITSNAVCPISTTESSSTSAVASGFCKTMRDLLFLSSLNNFSGSTADAYAINIGKFTQQKSASRDLVGRLKTFANFRDAKKRELASPIYADSIDAYAKFKFLLYCIFVPFCLRIGRTVNEIESKRREGKAATTNGSVHAIVPDASRTPGAPSPE